jgi:hypothetical protein
MQRGRRIFWLAAIPLIVSILIATLAPQPHGHWSEHLSAAGLKSVQLILLLVLLTLLGWRRLSVPLLLAFGVVASGIACQVVGDAQVAESIWRTSGNPESGAGYESGHETSELGDLLAFAGGLAFAIAAGIARRVPLKLAIGAAVLTIFPPPFFWPAVGVLVLVFHGLTSDRGFRRRPGAVAPGPPSHAPV